MKSKLKGASLDYEQKVWKQGKLVAGVDEVGRGCLAGPVVAVAVVLPIDFDVQFEAFDSKQINESKRKQIYEQLLELNIDYAVSFIDNNIVDEINILEATFLAMNTAINKLKYKPNHLLIDGNRFKNQTGIDYQTIIKGDAISYSIACASIIAKVERDNYMTNILHSQYPEYSFDKNKGYGTKIHYKALEKYGETACHRQTFLKKFHNNQINLFS